MPRSTPIYAILPSCSATSPGDRRPGIHTLLVLVLLALPGPSLAQTQYMDPGGYRYAEFSGSGTHLPVDCRLAPQAIVSWARTMTPTQSALIEAGRRGYVAVADTGYNLCEQGMSVALLGYEKPGVPNSAVTIIVRTQVNPENGEPFTEVLGGMLVVDFDRQTLVSADEIAAWSQAHASFLVDPATNQIVRELPIPGGVQRIDADDAVAEPTSGDAMQPSAADGFGGPWDGLVNVKRAAERFKKFYSCLLLRSNLCVMGAMLQNPTRFATPASLIQAVGACAVIASVSCFYYDL